MSSNILLILLNHRAELFEERPTRIQKLKQRVENLITLIGYFTVGATVGLVTVMCVDHFKRSPNAAPSVQYFVPDAQLEGNDTGIQIEISDDDETELIECRWHRIETPYNRSAEMLAAYINLRSCSSRNWLFSELSKTTVKQITI